MAADDDLLDKAVEGFVLFAFNSGGEFLAEQLMNHGSC
jgi:hypothetical protein